VITCACKPLGDLFGFTRPAGGFDIEAGSPLDRTFSTILIACSLLVLARRKLDRPKILKDNIWLFLLFSYMAISILWSDYPFISCKRWIRACGSILMALVVLSEPDPLRALEGVLRRSTYVLIPFSLLLVKYYSHIGHAYNRWSGERMWVGVTPQKNCLGRLCLISGFFLFWELIKRWRNRKMRAVRYLTVADALVLVMTIWLLVGSSSATSLAMMILGVTVFVGILVMRERLNFARPYMEFVAIALASALGFAYLLLGETLLSNALGTLGRDTTFTGRTEIWAILWPISWQHPILGQGYGSFWIHPPLERFNEAHNGYLDVFLELGIVGIILLAGFLASFYWRARKALSRNLDWAGFNICFLLMAVIHNMTESSFVQSTTQLWTVMIMLAIVSPALYWTEGTVDANSAASALTRAECQAGVRR
jgi:O-antigen ligase